MKTSQMSFLVSTAWGIASLFAQPGWRPLSMMAIALVFSLIACGAARDGQ